MQRALLDLSSNCLAPITPFPYSVGINESVSDFSMTIFLVTKQWKTLTISCISAHILLVQGCWCFNFSAWGTTYTLSYILCIEQSIPNHPFLVNSQRKREVSKPLLTLDLLRTSSQLGQQDLHHKITLRLVYKM